MKLKLQSKSSVPGLKKKRGKKISQAEKQNTAEVHSDPEAPTADEAPLQQHLDSASLSDCNEVIVFSLLGVV